MNLVLFAGHAISRPSIDVTGAIPCARIYLSTEHIVQDATGESQKQTEWHRIVAFKAAGEIALSLGVGDKIAVRGRLQSRLHERDGHYCTTTEVVAEEIEFLCKGNPEDAEIRAEQARFNRFRTDPDPALEISALFWRGQLDV